jgi:DNA repair protein RecO (recombination protein O)
LYNKTEAIVLRQYDFGEADKVITLYTKEFGKLKAVAKGVRRTKSRFGSSMELFSHNNIMLYMQRKRDLYVVTGSNIIRTHRELREDFDLFITGSYIAELVDKLTEPEEPNRRLFSLILETFCQIPKQDRDVIIAIFVTKFLINAGYKLNLEKCVLCENPIPLTQQKKLSIQQGGVLCPKCQSKDVQAIDVSLLALKYLRNFEIVNLVKVGKKIEIEASIRNELKRVVHFYLSHYLSGRLKTEEFMEKLISSSKM